MYTSIDTCHKYNDINVIVFICIILYAKLFMNYINSTHVQISLHSLLLKETVTY